VSEEELANSPVQEESSLGGGEEYNTENSFLAQYLY